MRWFETLHNPQLEFCRHLWKYYYIKKNVPHVSRNNHYLDSGEWFGRTPPHTHTHSKPHTQAISRKVVGNNISEPPPKKKRQLTTVGVGWR